MAHLKKRMVAGERRYDVRWREHGQERSKTFIREADALKFKTDTERKQQLGLLYDAPSVTLGAARDDWKARWMIGKAPATVARKDEAWPHMAVLEQIPLVDLRRSLVDDTIAAAARVAPRQAQIATQILKEVLRDAQARGQRFDPALLTVKAPSYEEREPVFLTHPELMALGAAMPAEKLEREMTADEFAGWMPEGMRRFPEFAGLTGLRLGELLGLLDSDVDLDGASVLVQRSFTGRTKTKKRRRVHLCPQALQLLREQLMARIPNDRGLVFPTSTGRMWNPDNFRARVWRPAVNRLAAETAGARSDELARVTIHDLRHTCASLMIAARANPLEIAETLGHTDGKGQPDATLIWKRYGHLYEGSGKRAAAALGRLLGERAA